MSGWQAMEGEVTELYAVIAEGQGIVAMGGRQGAMPMVTYVPRVAELFRERLDDIARQSGVPVALIRATGAEVIAQAKP